MMAEAIPLSQKSAEDGMRLIDQTYHNNLDLVRNMVGMAQPGSVGEVRERIQSIWEASLGTLRVNTQAVVQTNAKVMDSWSEFMHKSFDGGKNPDNKPNPKAPTPAT
jgi:hypothetical protein